MSMVYNVLFAAKATGTHHKLAMAGLTRVDRHDADDWRDLFLSELDAYLKGAKAPDDEFKDFKNHVLHVGDNFWGGAVGACQEWFGKAVEALGQRDWRTAAYNFGVFTHYLTDPIMPFHTGQSERETVIHRAAEWSVTKTYDELATMLQKELGGWPNVELSDDSDWLPRLVKQGATQAHKHYDFLIDHYNFDAGVKTPTAGWDRESKETLARLLGFAACAVGRSLERAIDEAGVFPPVVTLSLPALIASLNVPVKFITKNMGDAKERAQVEAMYVEYKQTGKVIDNLPEDDKTIRKLHCQEVLKIPLAELDKQKPGPIGAKWTGPAALRAKPPEKPQPKTAEKVAEKTVPRPVEKPVEIRSQRPAIETLASYTPPSGAPNKSVTVRRDDLTGAVPPAPHVALDAKSNKSGERSHEAKPENLKFYLKGENDLEAAPSIGAKTADRFAVHGIKTVDDFLQADPDELAQKLRDRNLDADTLREWQDQAALVCDVPNLRGHDAQILTGVGIRDLEELARANARDLFEMVDEFVAEPAGQRIIRGGEKPDLAEVGQWIGSAKKAKQATRA